jgi:hypothetical protein
LPNDVLEIRPVTGFEFRMEQFSIDANFKGTAARRYERQRFDPLAEFENLGRQTDSLRRIVSNYAVFDRYFGFHLELLSAAKLSVRFETVKNCRGSRVGCNPCDLADDTFASKSPVDCVGSDFDI